MDLYILDKTFTVIGLVDKYVSLIWTERYKEADDFEMEILLDDFLKTGIRPDYYVFQKNSRNLMVVEKFELKKEEDEPPKVIIKGRGLESIFSRRITTESLTIAKQNPDEVLEFLIKTCFTEASEERRKSDIPMFVDSGDEDIKNMEYSVNAKYEDVLNIILDMCDTLDVGIRAWFDEATSHFCYQIYKGVDRSWAQDDLTWVVYSPQFNNLLSTDFKYDNTSYKNFLTIFGEEASETTNPTTGDTFYWEQVTYTMYREDEPTGLDLREGVVDCSDVSRWQGDYILGTFDPKDPEDVTHGWKKLSYGRYLELLKMKAEDRLKASEITMVYEAEADENMQWNLGEHLYLGDIVQVVSEFTLESRCRVDSVIFSHDATGIRYYPTFVAVNNEITQKGGTVVW